MVVNEFLSKFARGLRKLLVRGVYVHAYQNPAESLRDVVDLIDRFIDGSLNYEMEWDDFISWKKPNPNIEKLRNELGEFEGLLFSKGRSDKLAYCNHLIDIRNRAAATIGIRARPPITDLPR